MRASLRRAGGALVALVVCLAALALATGSVVLVTTHGVSMEPLFHTGDLAVVIPSAGYHVGEIVAYHSPLLHIVVLHRIIAQHSGLFTIKGDNNHFLDPVRVPASAIVGRLVLHIPRAGNVVDWAHQPLVLGALAALAAALLTGRGLAGRRRARARQLAASSPSPGAAERLPNRSRSSARTFAGRGVPAHSAPLHAAPSRRAARSAGSAQDWWPVGAGALTLLALAWLTTVCWASAPLRTVPRPVGYAQQVVFSYSARAQAGTTYPLGRVSTGMPIFPRLVGTVDFAAVYRLRTGTGVAVSDEGTLDAGAMLQGPGGWAGTVATAAPVSFTGTSARTVVRVDLDRLGAVETRFAAETGVPMGDANLVITLTVKDRGALAGAAFSDAYRPSLTLQYSAQELTLPYAGPEASGPLYPELVASRQGTVNRAVRVGAGLSLLGRRVPVLLAQRATAAFTAAAGAALVALLLRALRRRRMDEPARIRARYGHEMVRLASSPVSEERRVADVADFAQLLRLARAYECTVLDHATGEPPAFYVELGGTLYRCVPGASSAPVTSQAVSAAGKAKTPRAEDEGPFLRLVSSGRGR